jgi:hypothetical protein
MKFGVGQKADVYAEPNGGNADKEYRKPEPNEYQKSP